MEEQSQFSKFKITIIIVSVALALVLLAILFYPFFRTVTPEIHNVFDRLYYEALTVKQGGNSVLISAPGSGYADYDLGQFDNIQIPDLDMCISIENDTLYFLFFNSKDTEEWNTSYCVLYKYELDEKKLYGERSLEYFVENFLDVYFEWSDITGEDNPYSQNDLGEYSFELQTRVSYN